MSSTLGVDLRWIALGPGPRSNQELPRLPISQVTYSLGQFDRRRGENMLRPRLDIQRTRELRWIHYMETATEGVRLTVSMMQECFRRCSPLPRVREYFALRDEHRFRAAYFLHGTSHRLRLVEKARPWKRSTGSLRPPNFQAYFRSESKASATAHSRRLQHEEPCQCETGTRINPAGFSA